MAAAGASTMQALRAHRRGGPEVLVYEQAPRPEPVHGEVLVAVHAAAITVAELGWEATWTRDGVDRTPTIPSHEFSGVVQELGPGVDRFRVGDQVYGLVPFDRDGAAADYVAVPTSDVTIRPSGACHAVAAAVALAGLTAWQALVDHAEVKPGDSVLVHGAAGGVGSLATQLAVALQARVTGTCLAADVAHVLALGADRAIEVDNEDFAAVPQAFDVVVDTVGGATPSCVSQRPLESHRGFPSREASGPSCSSNVPLPTCAADMEPSMANSRELTR